MISVLEIERSFRERMEERRKERDRKKEKEIGIECLIGFSCLFFLYFSFHACYVTNIIVWWAFTGDSQFQRLNIINV